MPCRLLCQPDELAPADVQKPRAERTVEEQRQIEEEDAAAAQELFCLCQQPDDPEAPRDFVQCDKCQQWFHPECVSTTAEVSATSSVNLVCHFEDVVLQRL